MRASYAGADERRRSRGVTYPQSSRTLLVISSVPRSIAASAAVPRSRRPYPRISRGFFAPVSPRQDPEGRSRGERPKPNPAEPEPNRPLHQPSPVMVPTRPNSWKFQISSEIKTHAIHGGQRPSATLQTFSKSLLSTRRHCVAVRAQDLLPGSALRISRTGLSPVSQTSTFLAHSASC